MTKSEITTLHDLEKYAAQEQNKAMENYNCIDADENSTAVARSTAWNDVRIYASLSNKPEEVERFIDNYITELGMMNYTQATRAKLKVFREAKNIIIRLIPGYGLDDNKKIVVGFTSNSSRIYSIIAYILSEYNKYKDAIKSSANKDEKEHALHKASAYKDALHLINKIYIIDTEDELITINRFINEKIKLIKYCISDRAKASEMLLKNIKHSAMAEAYNDILKYIEENIKEEDDYE